MSDSYWIIYFCSTKCKLIFTEADSNRTPETSSQISQVFYHTYLTHCAHWSDLSQPINKSKVKKIPGRNVL